MKDQALLTTAASKCSEMTAKIASHAKVSTMSLKWSIETANHNDRTKSSTATTTTTTTTTTQQTLSSWKHRH